MATTKKSTKAKTQTTKKPVIKTTTAARSAKPSVSTKIVKSAPLKKSSVSIRIKSNSIRRMQLFSAAVTAALAAAAGLLMSDRAYQLFTGLLAKNDLASQTTTVFAPAIHSVYDLELRWAVVAIMALSTLLPLVYLLRSRRGDDEVVNNRLLFWRWLEAGVITGLMVEVVALLSGIQDVMTLKVLGGIIVISALLRWSAERQQAEASSSRKSTSTLSVITCLLPGLLIGGYAVATLVYGMVRTPWYVYALYATLIASFIAYLINLRASVKQAQASTLTQRNYMLIGLVTRVAFALILIYGLKK